MFATRSSPPVLTVRGSLSALAPSVRFGGFILLTLLLGLGFGHSAQPPASERKSFEELKIRAEKGDAAAQLALGDFYFQGTGVAADPKKGARWHRKAAEQGLVKAQMQVGINYANGYGVKADLTEAYKWMRAAADQGLAEAQLECGYCSMKGEGAAKSPVEALRYFRLAADQGLAAAEYEVGKCYLEGSGAAKDVEEGVTWMRRSAVQGFAPAQNRLGLSYLKGESVVKDNIEAHKWFNLAAGQGGPENYEAKINLSKVETLLTAEEIATAQRLAREFKPSLAVQGGDPVAATSAPGNFGFVLVTAPQDGCDVFVNGEFVGNSPAKVKLAEGRHVIEVRKSGFRDFKREIRVGDQAELSLKAILEKQ